MFALLWPNRRQRASIPYFLQPVPHLLHFIAASYAIAHVPALRAAQAAPTIVTDGAMQVVVIKGHRLSAAEKAQLN